MRAVSYRFEGTRVAVTGAATGIGMATAKAFGTAGAEVWLLDVDDERGKAVAARIVAGKGQARYQHCDVTDTASVRNAFAAIESGSRGLDVVVNNAGGFWNQRGVADTTDDEWQDVIALNLTGVFLCARAAIPLLRRSDAGRIINIGSLAGQTTMHRSSPPYAAAKAGVLALSRVLAYELAAEDITVNALAPSAIMTERVKVVRGREERTSAAASIPLGRYGEPDDVVAAILFLASADAGYITGETIAVNGGRFMT